MPYKISVLPKFLALIAFITLGGYIFLYFFTTNNSNKLDSVYLPPVKEHSKSISSIQDEFQATLLRINTSLHDLTKRLTSLEKKFNDQQIYTLTNTDTSQESESREFVQLTPEEINASIQENLDRMNDTFNNEIIDASWSSKAESELTELVTRHINEGTNVLEIKCRGNTCRMEVSHDTINQSFNFDNILKNQSMSYYSQEIEDKDGSYMSIHYFVREGTSIDGFLNPTDEGR